MKFKYISMRHVLQKLATRNGVETKIQGIYGVVIQELSFFDARNRHMTQTERTKSCARLLLLCFVALLPRAVVMSERSPNNTIPGQA